MATFKVRFRLVLLSLIMGTQSTLADTVTQEVIPPESSKKYNISFNPIWLPFGSFDGQFEVGTSENMTAGVYISIFQYSSGDTKISSTGIGGKLNYYPGHLRWTDGWYISPFVQLIPTGWKEAFGSVSFTSISLGGVAGYHWGFKSGFNVMLGGGLVYSSATNSVEIDGRKVSSNRTFTGLWPAAELRLGYNF